MFRSRNSLSIVEVVILIGAAPYAPKELYIIPCSVCHTHLNESKDGCGDNCEVLTKREQRQIFTSMVSKSVEGLFSCCPAKSDKVFMFARTRSGEPFRGIDGLEEDSSFEMPTADMLNKRNIRHLTIDVKNPCLKEEEMANNDQGCCWLRFNQYFTHLN